MPAMSSGLYVKHAAIALFNSLQMVCVQGCNTAARAQVHALQSQKQF